MKRLFAIILLLSASNPANAEWVKDSEKSALDGTEVFRAYLLSSNEVANSIGSLNPAVMHVICEKKRTRVLFDFQNYMGRENVRLLYRIDQDGIKNATASVSEKGTVFGWWNGEGVKLLKSAIGKKELVVSAPPWGQGDIEAVFPIEGIDLALNDIRQSCGW